MHFQNVFNGGVSRILFSWIIFTLLLVGCSKKKGMDPPFTGDLVNLSVLVQGVKSPDISSSLRASIGNQVGLHLPEKRNSVTLFEDDVFLDIISEEEDLPSDIDFNSSIKGRAKYAADVVPMENGIKYRLMLYNATSDEFYASVEATVGQTQHISVIPGQEYKWYAYSYNTNSAIPIPSNVNNPTIITPTTTTLLYASGTTIASTEGTALPIIFAHQLTQLKVEVKEGIRAILSTVGTFNQSDYVKTSIFNLKDGIKGPLSSAGITTLNFSSFTKNDTIMRVAEYYTADDMLTSYNVNISSIRLQYTSTSQRTLDSNLPSSGNITFTFPESPLSKKGYILKGALKISFVLPLMKIQPFANNDLNNTYRIAPGSKVHSFLTDQRNFGTLSTSYVKSNGFNIPTPSAANLAAATNAGRARLNALLNNPAEYPDILIFSNYHDYASYGGHELMNDFLLAGGAIFYAYDNANLEDPDKAGPGLALIVDDPGANLQKRIENNSVYAFTDTPSGADDALILRGPFGNITPYYWGQDRQGTSYITNITNSNIIIYSNQPVNKTPNNFINQGAFLRHKTKNFFFVGDGGFYGGRPAYANSLNREPFRTNANNFPVLAAYGDAYDGFPAGHWQIANSFVFGNAIAYMMDRVHYYGINRSVSGRSVTPDPIQADEIDEPDEPGEIGN